MFKFFAMEIKEFQRKSRYCFRGGDRMRLVDIKKVKPGMILALPIYDSKNGKKMLAEKVELNCYYLNRLKELKYTHIYIKDPGDDDDFNVSQAICQPVKHETKIKATMVLKNIVATYYQTKKLDIVKLQDLITDILDQIIGNNEIFYNMLDIRTYDNYTYEHSVNVCILSLIIGYSLQLRRDELRLLGIGAVLHDVGKIFIESEILNKPGRLETEEFEKIKTHTSRGYDFLKTKECVSFIAAHIAYQHHERNDGSGYPRGLTADQIHRFAKIVAVTDVYDAMTAHRVYRSALPSYLAVAELRAGAGVRYDREIVELLVEFVALYFIGSELSLDNGERVLVVNVSRTQCLVKVLDGPIAGTTFDLYQYPEIKVITEKTD
jgi:HD-GYP domain-containing protein (c-di-GMP phosphodiesterase class II)